MLFSREALLWALIYYGFSTASPASLEKRYTNSSTSSIPAEQSTYDGFVGENGGSLISTSSRPGQSPSGVGSLVVSTSSFSTTTGISVILSTSSLHPSTSTVPGSPLPTTTHPETSSSSKPSESRLVTTIKISPSFTGTGSTSTSGLWNTTSSASGGTNHSTTVTVSSSSTKPTTLSTSSSTLRLNSSTSSCSTLEPGEAVTVWSIVPNTNTVTITVYGNASTSISTTPDFTPPTYCPTAFTSSPSSSAKLPPSPTRASSVLASSISSFLVATETASKAPVGTTTIITSKQPVTVITMQPGLSFPGQTTGVDKTVAVDPATSTPVDWGPISVPGGGGQGPTTIPFTSSPPGNTQPANSPGNGGNGGGSGGGGGGAGGNNGGAGGGGSTPPITTSIGSVPIVIQPGQGSSGGSSDGGGSGGGGSGGGGSGGGGQVIVGGQTVAIPTPGSGSGSGGGGGGTGSGGNNVIVTADGQVFTINPSQVIGGGSTVAIPPANTGALFAAPTQTTIAGVPVQISPSSAVINGITYSIGPGAPETTIVADGQTISIGPAGLGFAQTTVSPPTSSPSNVVVINAKIFSVIGSSLAVIEGHTFTFGPSSAPVTDDVDGETITIGPNGVSFDGTTLGGITAQPTDTKFGVAGGISVTEVGSTLAVINGMTFTVGPGATPTTTVINGHTIVVGPSGLDVDSTTLNYPFNPMTQTITAGGITFSEIGSSLVVIGGTTFTVGPAATPTTDVYNGQTISIGPNGVGFASTTVPPLTSTPTSTTGATETGKGKKNGAGRVGPVCEVWATCIAIALSVWAMA